MNPIRVVEYDPRWRLRFEAVKEIVWPLLSDIAVSIQHVGSTSVPGLAAKPVIDLSVVVTSEKKVTLSIDRLASIGYVHRGQMGVEGREAFRSPEGSNKHHLYVCLEGSVGIRNHLVIRDFLLSNPDAVRVYGRLKKELATRYPHDVDGYIDGKTEFLIGILRRSGMSSAELNAVEESNRKPT